MKQYSSHKITLLISTATFIVILIATLAFAGLSMSTLHASELFARNLRLGDSGQDVFRLQALLNSNPLTAVASFGPGSPGLETLYFGTLTLNAVTRFQELYRSEILTPLALYSGTGYVGPSTRAKLNNLPLSNQSTTSPQPLSTFPAVNRSFENRNQQLTNPGLNSFLTYTKQAALKSGMSDEKIKLIEESIISQAESGDNLDQIFVAERLKRGLTQTRSIQEIRRDTLSFKQSLSSNNFSSKVLARSLERYLPALSKSSLAPLINSLAGKKVIAQSLPVGGLVTYRYLCTCSFTWLITLSGPTYGTVDYETGTQAYQSYNLPYATNLLGNTQTTGSPICVSEPEAECGVVISSTNGLLTSVVGSSSQ